MLPGKLHPLMSLCMDICWSKGFIKKVEGKNNVHAGFDIAKNVFFSFFMFISLAKDENPLDLDCSYPAYSLTPPLIQTQLEPSHRIILFF